MLEQIILKLLTALDVAVLGKWSAQAELSGGAELSSNTDLSRSFSQLDSFSHQSSREQLLL